MELGIHFSHELFAPGKLLRMAREAEQVGFTHACCSDHFHPWSEQQGQSGFAWSWLGAAMQATKMSFVVVNAPGQRYHPAIIAQAAATLAEMFPGRFWMAVGSGESLNEHITGEAWPDKVTRNARLKESAWLITQLWDGEEVTHSGLIRINKSKLYSLPTVRPKLMGAALSEETSGWLGTWADGLITTGSNSELRRNIDAFKKSGGKSKPVYCQSAIVYAPKIEDANNYALKYWRVAAVPTDQLSNLEMPRDFDSASLASSADRILSSLRITDNAAKIVEWLRSDRDAGVDRVYINFIGPDWHAFLGMFAKNILLNEKNLF